MNKVMCFLLFAFLGNCSLWGVGNKLEFKFSKMPVDIVKVEIIESEDNRSAAGQDKGKISYFFSKRDCKEYIGRIIGRYGIKDQPSPFEYLSSIKICISDFEKLKQGLLSKNKEILDRINTDIITYKTENHKSDAGFCENLCAGIPGVF